MDDEMRHIAWLLAEAADREDISSGSGEHQGTGTTR